MKLLPGIQPGGPQGMARELNVAVIASPSQPRVEFAPPNSGRWLQADFCVNQASIEQRTRDLGAD